MASELEACIISVGTLEVVANTETYTIEKQGVPSQTMEIVESKEPFCVVAKNGRRLKVSAKHGPVAKALQVGLKVGELLDVDLGCIKQADGCGNTSVAMGVAEQYFIHHPNCHVLGVVNSGSQGDKLYVYGRKDNITFVMEEVRGKENRSSVQQSFWASLPKFTPKDKANILSLSENARRWGELLHSSDYIGSDTPVAAPVIAFITGPLRDAYFTASEVEQAELNQEIRCLYFSQFIVEAYNGSQFCMPQKEEGNLELKATQALYRNMVTKNLLKPVVVIGHLGIGGSSSQFTLLKPDGTVAFSLEYKCGMSGNLDTLVAKFEELKSELQPHIANLHTAHGDARLVLALKSGCAILMDEEPKLREMLMQV